MYYLIESTLTERTLDECIESEKQYVIILTPEEWLKQRERFEMGIDLEIDAIEVHNTKAEVNYDSLTGTFSIPSRRDVTGDDYKFAFALDEKGIVFIDSSGRAEKIVRRVKNTKKWRMPSLERFMYDFLEQIIHSDQALLEKYERELVKIEDRIAENDDDEEILNRVNEIRGDVRELHTHYEQLIDFGQELEENENNFFKEQNERYFRLFINKATRLQDKATSLRDYTVQIRDLQKTQLDVKQNRIMTILTVVTTIFMPLTLIVGWYGMNFKYMPELQWKISYPIVILVSLFIGVGGLIYFKKKRWL
ncbi:MAG: magnesium transporter CorA [Clostridiales bacterium]|nr:magnesium transporter CorA [Clostridiales bacterium]